ncbi:DUF6311 domain-containing protein [Tianweitania sediminis]|uniref:Glycosyltransferase RgtA/B/C/D-like domain-containing protein n=1 Tax=Tianweitania sediminis TaxID=1502156 RepID=A0A8J7RPX9_9HYPH|nr:hypothetical protein [Tianweitania sediminis]
MKHSSSWRTSPSAAYGLGAFLALLLVAWLFPLSFLLGKGFFFEFGDPAQHVSGWLLYAADEWRWPLLVTQRIAPPDGLAIFLTDSIPLAALLFKPLAGVLPEGFHYFGLWQAFNKLLQALAAVYLIRSFGLRHPLHAVVAAAFALLWPAHLIRVTHTALATHGFILIAIAFYVRARSKPWSDAKAFGLFALLSLGALLVHPYLCAMVLAIHGAFLIDRLCDRPKRHMALAALVVSCLALATALIPLGYLSGGQTRSGGYDIYSMNLASPFCGGKLSLCGPMNTTGGQYEGFNNLGLGLLLLIPIALWAARKEVVPLAKRSPGLILVALGLVVYAASNMMWLGPYLIFHYEVPQRLAPLTQTFRASGRFFWPVGYLVLFFTLCALLRHVALRWASALLACALTLQGIDALPQITSIQQQTEAPGVLDFPAWQRALADIDHIEVFPRYGCVASLDAPYIFLQLLAGHMQTTISTAYQPRPDQRCAAELRNGPTELQNGTLLVSLAESVKLPEPPAVEQATDQDQCRRLTIGTVVLIACTTNKATDWDQIGFPAEPVR